jgi:hypothetical protein
MIPCCRQSVDQDGAQGALREASTCNSKPAWAGQTVRLYQPRSRRPMSFASDCYISLSSSPPSSRYLPTKAGTLRRSEWGGCSTSIEHKWLSRISARLHNIRVHVVNLTRYVRQGDYYNDCKLIPGTQSYSRLKNGLRFDADMEHPANWSWRSQCQAI